MLRAAFVSFNDSLSDSTKLLGKLFNFKSHSLRCVVKTESEPLRCIPTSEKYWIFITGLDKRRKKGSDRKLSGPFHQSKENMFKVNDTIGKRKHNFERNDFDYRFAEKYQNMFCHRMFREISMRGSETGLTMPIMVQEVIEGIFNSYVLFHFRCLHSRCTTSGSSFSRTLVMQ